MPLIAGAGALIGGIGGLFKSGPDLNMEGRRGAADSLAAFRNLVGRGPGEQDVAAATTAGRDYAQQLGNIATGGLYNMGEGNRLAEMQFAPQRQALAQALQDQMAQANRAAASAGRSTNDPILRARLGAQAMRETAGLQAQQSAAAMDLGRQSTLDMLNLQGQRVNTLGNLSAQAFANQSNLFNMNQNLFNMDLSAAGYENSRGGGIKGAISGAITGAGAGLQFATGLGQLDFMKNMSTNPVAAQQIDALNNFKMGPNQTMNQVLGITGSAAQIGANMTTPVQQLPAAQPTPFNAQYFNPANFAGNNVQYGPARPTPVGNVFGPNSMVWK